MLLVKPYSNSQYNYYEYVLLLVYLFIHLSTDKKLLISRGVGLMSLIIGLNSNSV